jgi:uncharacterized membrane protein YedE/YeeE
MNKSGSPQWSPYLAGGLTGALIVVSAWTTGNLFGASTSFARTTGMLEKIFMPERVVAMEYFRVFVPKIDWQWMFVLGVLIGSAISSFTSNTFRWQPLPDMWQQRFGSSQVKRVFAAFGGGAVAMFGARLAGGCPSGHGLSGTLQLGISGYITLTGFFVGGIIMAFILYGRGKKR